MASRAAAERHDLSDIQWQHLHPLLPEESSRGRPCKWTRRQIIDGIRCRYAPVRHGVTCARTTPLGRRCIDGSGADSVTARGLASWPVLQAAADAAGRVDSVSVDSTISRFHQRAAGSRRDGDRQKEPLGGIHAEPVDHALGRSRGGWTTKTHLACNQAARSSPPSSRPATAVTARDLTTVLRPHPGHPLRVRPAPNRPQQVLAVRA